MKKAAPENPSENIGTNGNGAGSGVLYVVPTPVGNLGDMSLRGIETLRNSDLILAEDTRTSGFLLRHFSIDRPMMAYHQHNEHKLVSEITDMLRSGKNISMISDAGTPGISDAGFLLVREASKKGITVITLPGATAFVPALINSGFPCNEFAFYGFLPQKKGRQTKLRELEQEEKTFILYESPYRLAKLLHALSEHLGAERQASISREISKLHEETRRGTLGELSAWYADKTVKGEIVVVIAGKEDRSHEQET
jgi:16S rRNA (cytidine1402-2'-O)-methyltransferase